MNINIKNPKDLLLCGVYCIKNIKNNKLYIGSTTVQFVKRLNLHVWELNSNKHKNKYLQNSWNKYKEDSFIFEIIEICDKNKCLERGINDPLSKQPTDSQSFKRLKSLV